MLGNRLTADGSKKVLILEVGNGMRCMLPAYAAPFKELSARPPCKACMTHSNALPAISILVVLIMQQTVGCCLGRHSRQAMLSSASRAWSTLYHAVTGVLSAGWRPQHQL